MTVKPSLMIPLHCLWAKSNNRMHDQFECDLTWYCFWYDFVHMRMQVRLLFYSLRFQVMQIKQVDCKMSTKYVNNYKRHFVIFFGKLHIQEHKATKKQIVKLQLNEKKSKESQTRLMS